MNAALQMNFVSVDEYLDGEMVSKIRHEYVGGTVYAMAGVSDAHNLITANLLTAIHHHLRGGPCRVFFTELKVRLLIANEDIFYYPDLMVTCHPQDTERYFKRFPKLVIEVLSPTTERTDRSEKFLNYIQIESLEEYVLVAQDRMEATVFRRVNQWKPEIVLAPNKLRFASLNLDLSLTDIYESVAL